MLKKPEITLADLSNELEEVNYQLANSKSTIQIGWLMQEETSYKLLVAITYHNLQRSRKSLVKSLVSRWLKARSKQGLTSYSQCHIIKLINKGQSVKYNLAGYSKRKVTNMANTKAKTYKASDFKGFAPDKKVKTKVCSITGKKLPITEFWKDRWMKDGYTSYSKEGYRLRWILKDPAYKSKRTYRQM